MLRKALLVIATTALGGALLSACSTGPGSAPSWNNQGSTPAFNSGDDVVPSFGLPPAPQPPGDEIEVPARDTGVTGGNQDTGVSEDAFDLDAFLAEAGGAS